MSQPDGRVAEALARSPVLGALDGGVRQRLAAAGAPVELEAGTLLFQSGDAGDAALVILVGELEVRRQGEDGRELVIGTLRPGAVVGEMAVVDGEPRSADVWAARRTRLWRIPRAALIGALEADPRAALALVAELSRRLRAANAALQASRLEDLGTRLGRFLREEQGGQGLVGMTQTEIARRLGFSREKVNRKLNEWARAGRIELGRSGVRVVRPEEI